MNNISNSGNTASNMVTSNNNITTDDSDNCRLDFVQSNDVANDGSTSDCAFASKFHAGDVPVKDYTATDNNVAVTAIGYAGNNKDEELVVQSADYNVTDVNHDDNETNCADFGNINAVVYSTSGPESVEGVIQDSDLGLIFIPEI